MPAHPDESPTRVKDETFLVQAFSRMPDWVTWLFLLISASLTLLVSALVLSRKWAIGIEGQWQWSFREILIDPLLLLPSLILLLLLAGLLAIVARRGIPNRFVERIFLCAMLALSLWAVLSIGGANPSGRYSAYDSIVAPWAGGYYGEAVRVEDMGEYLDNYKELISSLRVNDIVRGHIADHPAGPVLFHWLVNRSLGAIPSLSSLLIPADADQPLDATTNVTPRMLAEQLSHAPLSQGKFAGIWGSALLFRLGFWLTIPIVYFLARSLISREAGMVAAALTAVVPSLHLFGPYSDQLFSLFFMSSIFCWHKALRRGGWMWAGGSSLIVFTGLMWSLSMLVIPAVLFFWTLFAAYQARLESGAWPWRKWSTPLVSAFAVFLISTLLPSILFGYDTVEVWRICLAQHATFAPLFPRSYMSWTLFNPVEFMVFTGLPTALLFLAACVADVGIRRHDGERRAWSPCLWSLVAVLVLLNLSGKNLGETARLWMFMMPLAAVGASVALVGLDRRRGWLVVIVVVLCAVQLAAFHLSLNVFKV